MGYQDLSGTTKTSFKVGAVNLNVAGGTTGQVLTKTGATTATWQTPSGGITVINGPANISGDYFGDVYLDVDGVDITLTSAVTIYGSLFIQGSGQLLTTDGGTNCNSIDIKGNLYTNANIRLTSTNDGVNGGSLLVKGSAYSTGSSIYTNGSDSVAGTGGSGGAVNVGGDCLGFNEIITSAGATNGSFNARNAGNIQITGDLRMTTGITAKGGDSNTGGNGGAGGNLTLGGSFLSNIYSSFNGGIGTSGNGGSGGVISIGRDNYSSIDANGGNAQGLSGDGGGSFGITINGDCMNSTLNTLGGDSLAGSGGSGGLVVITQNGINLTITTKGGNADLGSGGTGGAGNAVIINGNLSLSSLYASGGNSGLNSAGNGGNITIKGNAIACYEIFTNGGLSNDLNGGNGGVIMVYGDAQGSFQSVGGDSMGSFLSMGNGGNGNDISIFGTISSNDWEWGQSSVTTRGGDCNTSGGSPGNGGNILISHLLNSNASSRGGQNSGFGTGGTSGSIQIRSCSGLNSFVESLAFQSTGVFGSVDIGDGNLGKLRVGDNAAAGTAVVTFFGSVRILLLESYATARQVYINAGAGSHFNAGSFGGPGTPLLLSGTTTAISADESYFKGATAWQVNTSAAKT